MLAVLCLIKNQKSNKSSLIKSFFFVCVRSRSRRRPYFNNHQFWVLVRYASFSRCWMTSSPPRYLRCSSKSIHSVLHTGLLEAGRSLSWSRFGMGMDRALHGNICSGLLTKKQYHIAYHMVIADPEQWNSTAPEESRPSSNLVEKTMNSNQMPGRLCANTHRDALPRWSLPLSNLSSHTTTHPTS